MEFNKLNRLLDRVRSDLIEKSSATFGKTWILASVKDNGEVDFELDHLEVIFPNKTRWNIEKIESDE